MGDKFVIELFEEAINGLVSKEKFQSDINCLVSSLNDVNKTISTLTTRLENHIKQANIDANTFCQETSRLNTKIDNVHTQVLEK
jgi:uncharacterized protein Yka (UPF0111/DUF47 family)